MAYGELKEFAEEALSFDWVQMVDIVATVHRSDGGDVDGAEVLRRAGDGAAQLVRDGILVPGWIGDDGFEPWESTVDESAERIRREVREVAERGGEITLGDIAWFAAPE
ncbi:hypothetical protein [Allokutzneria sp. NRRL B-24872]|uniref:hypothetical protein n=1 Tax=Allokutzneria sp. NRRL B-24872 TaxID=1137961 RepID=UPI000A3AB7F0|nr:hypothetical protein [Allokutzneria sp. NRRL B-24872]